MLTFEHWHKVPYANAAGVQELAERHFQDEHRDAHQEDAEQPGYQEGTYGLSVAINCHDQCF